MRKLLPVTALLLCVCSELYGGTVSGRLTFLTRRGQKVNPAETLVWLEPLIAAVATKPVTAVMSTREKTLLPHVLAVPAHSTVQFPNEDPISHNLFSVSASNTFDLGLYRRGPGKSQKFTKPGMVNVYCNVHPNMSAVIHVMNTPYYGFADANGAFTFADVPGGTYKLRAWSEQGGTTEQEITVAVKAPLNVVLTLDGRTVRSAQHMNKFGKPYQTKSRAKDY